MAKLADAYLFLYNVVQAIGWFSVFLSTVMALWQGVSYQAAFQFGSTPAGGLRQSATGLLLAVDRITRSAARGLSLIIAERCVGCCLRLAPICLMP